VCACLQDLTRRALDSLLYDQVTDPATRGMLDRYWGFCPGHAAVAGSTPGAPLPTAIVYHDLLVRARARLETARRELVGFRAGRGWRRLLPGRRRLSLVRRWATRARCPLCATAGEAEAGYLRTTLDHLEEPAFARAYAASAGLCLPHVLAALATSHRGADRLVVHTLQKLDRLAADLRGFVDKHDHQSRTAFTPEEAAAWTEALAFFVGSGPRLSSQKGAAGTCDSS
jgi:hypothetical protein